MHIQNFRSGLHPCLDAVVKSKFAGCAGQYPGEVQALLAEGRAKVEPAFKWFEDKMAEEGLQRQMNMFKVFLAPPSFSLTVMHL